MNKYSLSIEEVKQVDPSKFNAVAIYKQIRADFETPLSIYLKLQGGDYSYLLESAEFGRQGRYSLIGTDPYEVYVSDTTSDIDPLTLVEEKLQEIILIKGPTESYPGLRKLFINIFEASIAASKCLGFRLVDDKAKQGILLNRPPIAAPTVPEYKTSSPKLAPWLMPLTNKSGFLHKLGQFENLAIKFNAISGFTKN